ncbi:monoacylglycerol lipase ABHD2-like [Hydractinia symbiolongicarpus]|uniref:monoacylglycerol lipase ABHD2-like n=1 Tax=Hydractinia symbiolongicarpus TaxID=13093 RepID=UPI00254BDD68|nr:monoacylglycerol lipase ABHD2-like [Hydractinia symbiolongicarpus]
MSFDFYFYLLVFFVLVFAVLISRILWYAKDVPKSELFYQESSEVVKKIIANCQCLNENYVPTYLWGKSGHIQSMLYTIFGRFGRIPPVGSKRYKLVADDGTQVSFDIFEALESAKETSKTILVVPGICNHAENVYIRAFSSHMTNLGYTVVIFNHTGALKSIELKKPKIFTYGQTDDLDFVVQTLLRTRNVKKLIAVGFSLGANILMKYLGEKPNRQENFYFAASICQGYNVPECNVLMQEKENLRWMYNYGLTRNMLRVILHHKDTLSKHLNSRDPPLDLNWKKISSAKALNELDLEFTIKLAEENSIEELYENCSSSKYLENIYIPLLILNAKDDPLIPEQLFKYPKNLIGINHKVLFVVTPYGGHMGYFEGGVIFPDRLSWVDRLLAQYIGSTLDILKDKESRKEGVGEKDESVKDEKPRNIKEKGLLRNREERETDSSSEEDGFTFVKPTFNITK